jgi:hypothetical protein
VAKGAPAGAVNGNLGRWGTHNGPFVITIHCTVNDMVSKVTRIPAYATIISKESITFV